MTIAQDLKALNKDIQSLGKTLDRLLKAVEKDTKSKAKPTKKIAAKKAPAKTAPAKTAPAKKAAPPTATDEILKIIKGSKKDSLYQYLIYSTQYLLIEFDSIGVSFFTRRYKSLCLTF